MNQTASWNSDQSPSVTLEEAHPEDIRPVDDDSRDTVDAFQPQRSPAATKPYASPRKRKNNAHPMPQKTPRRTLVTESGTLPPPPRKVTPKSSKQKDVENFKMFEAEESTSLVDDLRMSDDSAEQADEKDENDVGDGLGRNNIYPSGMEVLSLRCRSDPQLAI